MQVPHELANPRDPDELQAAHRRKAKVLNGGVSFGEVNDWYLDPATRTTVVRPGSPNGLIDNIDGRWVYKSVLFAEFGTALTFTHNLGAATVGLAAANANVFWFESWKSIINPPPDLQLVFCHGDTVTADSIQLRPTSSNPPFSAEVAVFFINAGRW